MQKCVSLVNHTRVPDLSKDCNLQRFDNLKALQITRAAELFTWRPWKRATMGVSLVRAQSRSKRGERERERERERDKEAGKHGEAIDR